MQIFADEINHNADDGPTEQACRVGGDRKTDGGTWRTAAAGEYVVWVSVKKDRRRSNRMTPSGGRNGNPEAPLYINSIRVVASIVDDSNKHNYDC